ncbi:MAG TPA: hypothetical protein VEV87_04495 [Chitinophagaceae bacterium]|nr:hypothetical protein [Chitinophagaceae bacterium]
MKKLMIAIIAALSLLVIVSFINRPTGSTGSFIEGTPEIKSISALTFGPDGVLFIGDSKSAAVFAIKTNDLALTEKASPVDVKNVDQKIAALLGTEAKNITIQDLKVNPISKKLYCAVQSADGTPVLLTIDKDNIQAVSLKNVTYSTITLNNAPAEDAKGRGGRPLRLSSISDLDFSNGKLLVSGLSNQEFRSSFRSIPFPFTKSQDQSSLEIYHAAHGRYETEAPIETFTTAELNGKKFLVASYTCTPLVLFPLDDLKAGQHVKGRTVAELGSGNRPLDMITMKKDNDQFLIIANSERPVMKVKYKDIETYQESLTSPVKEAYSSAGVPYVSFPVGNVLQLDKLDDNQFIFLQRRPNGDLNIATRNNQSL